jgi:ATP-binding cassette, subfamily B, bacterial
MKTLPKTLPAFFWYFIKKQWKSFAAIQFFTISWSLDQTFWPFILMMFIDTLTQIADQREVMWSALSTPIILAICLWMYVELSYRLSGFISSYAVPKIEARVRMEMFEYVQHHAYSYFSGRFAGSIANKISDMPQAFSRLIEQTVRIFIPILIAIIISIILFAFVQMQFALILGVWIVLHITICALFSRKASDLANLHAESRSVLNGKIVDSLSNHLNVKIFARYAAEIGYIWKYQNDEKSKQINSFLYLEKMKIGLGLLTIFGLNIGISWYILINWQRGIITTGEVVFIFNAAWNIAMMVWMAGMEFPQFIKDIGVCQQALSIISDSHDIIDAPDAKPLKVPHGEIIFDDVTFHYDEKKRLFQNKNIVIRAGEKVGLVGFSGSGKTTFVHLILRYFDVEEGRILIDGQDIYLVTQDSLRAQIAMIPQDPILFHRSLMENIRYGRPDATDKEVLEASKMAYCDDFVQQLPEKYNSLVGERGMKLSGGQRQRIAIARAILKDAPILILDEATSALDSVTEEFIQRSLDELMENRTTIVIAHRLSTLKGMDRIFVFDNGIIIEEGSHESLVEQNGFYAKMWGLQAGGFLLDGEEEEE